MELMILKYHLIYNIKSILSNLTFHLKTTKHIQSGAINIWCFYKNYFLAILSSAGFIKHVMVCQPLSVFSIGEIKETQKWNYLSWTKLFVCNKNVWIAAPWQYFSSGYYFVTISDISINFLAYCQAYIFSWGDLYRLWLCGLVPIHHSDVTMSAMASHISGVSIVWSTVCSGADQLKHQTCTALASVNGNHRQTVDSLHKGADKLKMFPFDDVIMIRAKLLRYLK